MEGKVIPLRGNDVVEMLKEAQKIGDLRYGIIVVMDKDDTIYTKYDCATLLQAIGMLEAVKQRMLEEW